MGARSIRFRLTAWYAVMLAAALCLFSGLIWFSLRERLTGESEEDLRGTASRFEAYLRQEAADESGPSLVNELEEFCQALPGSSYVDLRGPGGLRFRHPGRGAGGLRNVQSIRREIRIGRDTYALEVGVSQHGIYRTMELLRLLLLSLIPAAVAIACFGGAWLSRRALRPVDDVTVAARTIGIENLSQRLPVPRTGDELQRLTEVWNGMLGRLESAVGTLSQFAADASHELRTPLAVIRTSAELALRRARTPESYRESLQDIVAEAERMTLLVEDLLFLSQSDTRNAAMAMSPVDVAGLLSEIAGELRDLADVRGLRLTLAATDRTPVISGNRMALRRLFLVLIDNAFKYSHPGGAVKVSVTCAGDSVAVAVQDFGIGIAAGDLPHIFQRFYRADKARSNGGHGLGLSLAASLARAHSAMVDVQSEEGKGSVFSVTFPLRPANLPALVTGAPGAVPETA